MKRILSLVLALSMVLAMFSFSFAASSFEDVVGTDCEAAVSALVELGIVNGRSENKYEPNEIVTRAEMAKLLVIAAGLEGAADVREGATKFNDVKEDHWATGYINVAAEYGYIMGYPDGSFKPDTTVTNAEAVTMALRVAGYKTVIEAKGTYPTNYIAKGTELKVLRDISYKSYNDGATRGNMAILMFNLLRIPMWDVDSESETGGITYKNTGTTMIEKYFTDYTYIDEDIEATVIDIDVKDGEVTVELQDNVSTSASIDGTYVLAEGIDFLELYGRKVSGLYNEKTEKLVVLVPNTEDKVVAGYKDDLDDDGYTFKSGAFASGDYILWGDDATNADYTSGVIDTKKVIEYATIFDTTNTIVVEKTVAAKNDATKVTPVTGASFTIDEDAIVLFGTEWGTAKDIKAGDVLTTLVAGELYIVCNEAPEGSFDEVTYEEELSAWTYYVEVEGKKYEEVLVAEVVEVDEDGEEVATTDLADIMADDESKFYDEDCTLYLNFLGEVVRIEFNEVDDKEAEGNFYVATNIPATWDVSDKTGTTVYIELNGEDYEVKSSAVVAAAAVNPADVVFVKFDSKDRVKEITVVADGIVAVIDDYVFDAVTSGDMVAKDVIDDNNYIGSGDTHKVNSNTTVFTIVPIEDEDDSNIIDHYEVEISKGATELKGVEECIVAIEFGDAYGKAAYVFTWSEAKNTDNTFGIIEKYTESKGTRFLTIDGNKYEVDEDEVLTGDEVGALVAFVENDDGITITKLYTKNELAGGDFVTDVEDNVATTTGGMVDLDVLEDTYEDYKVIFVTISKNLDTDEYEFDEWEEIEYSEIKLKKDDILAATQPTDDVDIILIIRGYEI